MSNPTEYLKKLRAAFEQRAEIPLLNEQEQEFLILALGYTRGDDGFTDEDVSGLMSWCQSALIQASFIKFALNGLVLIGWDENAKEPLFQLTPLGKTWLKEQENLLATNFVDAMKGILDSEE